MGAIIDPSNNLGNGIYERANEQHNRMPLFYAPASSSAKTTVILYVDRACTTHPTEEEAIRWFVCGGAVATVYEEDPYADVGSYMRPDEMYRSSGSVTFYKGDVTYYITDQE